MTYKIPQRKLGKTGSLVSVLALGGAAIGSNPNQIFFEKTVSDELAIQTIHGALSNGINLIDTSPFYGDSERKIGLALKDYGQRNSFMLSTKAGTHPSIRGYTKDIFFRSVENSLKVLQTDYIDILNIHDPSIVDLREALAANGAIEAMLALRKQGLVRYFSLGVRAHTLHRQFMETGLGDCILPYFDYNLLRQDLKELLFECKEREMGVMLGSALCMGYLSGKNPKNIAVSHFEVSQEIDISKAREMYDWCIQQEQPLLAMNYRYILANEAISSIIVGMASPQEVLENIQAICSPPSKEKYDAFMRHFEVV